MESVKVILLGAQSWSFKDEVSGELREGTSVYVSPLQKSTYSNNIAGQKPVKYTLPLSEYEKYESLDMPAIATMSFEFNFSNGRLYPTDFTNIEPISELVQ